MWVRIFHTWSIWEYLQVTPVGLRGNDHSERGPIIVPPPKKIHLSRIGGFPPRGIFVRAKTPSPQMYSGLPLVTKVMVIPNP